MIYLMLCVQMLHEQKLDGGSQSDLKSENETK